MTQDQGTPEHWGQHERPPSLFRRFKFGGYSETRVFLDQLAELSKEANYYPDISFGTTYANVTVHARDSDAISSEDLAFARRVSALAPAG